MEQDGDDRTDARDIAWGWAIRYRDWQQALLEGLDPPPHPGPPQPRPPDWPQSQPWPPQNPEDFPSIYQDPETLFQGLGAFYREYGKFTNAC